MLCKDTEPFAMVEREGFSNLIKVIEPRYALPNRKYFSGSWLNDTYTKISTAVKNDLKDVEHISITTDIWTCTFTNDAYLSLTAHYLDEDFQSHSKCLTVENFNDRHNAPNIKDTMQTALDEFDIKKESVHLAVRDNASNMVAGLREADIPNVGCLAHTLELVVKEAILDSQESLDTLAAFRKLVGHYKHSVVASAALKKVQETHGIEVPLKLVQDVPTCWGSSYTMLERALNLKKYILLSNVEIEYECEISSQMWKHAELLHKALGVFFDAVMQIEGDLTKSPISIAIPTINSLKDALSHEEGDEKLMRMKSLLAEALSKRLGNMETKSVYTVATFLDPRYKDQYFFDELASLKTINIVTGLYEDKCDDKPLSSYKKTETLQEPQAKRLKLQHFSNKIKEKKQQKDTDNKAVKLILETYAAAELIESEPLKFWACYPDPILRSIAKEYLCAPCSSAPSERVFSKTGQIVTSLRSRLKPHKVKKLLFLNKNL